MQKISDSLFSDLASDILDTNKELNSDTISKIEDMWSVDIFTRKAGPAYIMGDTFKNNLDLSSFLYELMKRRAIIQIPEYKSHGVVTVTEGQSRVGDIRFGPIVKLVSNQDTFAFGILIRDQSIVSSEEVGDYRTYTILDHTGEFYSGWNRLSFMPNEEEKKYIHEQGISDALGNIEFDLFVHPNRWVSFYGKCYLLTKLLQERLGMETKELNNILKYEEARKTIGENEEPKSYPKREEHGSKVSYKFKTVTVDVHRTEKVLGNMNESRFAEYNLGDYETVCALRNRKDEYNRTKSTLQFITRGTELALYSRLLNSGFKAKPAWINAVWEKDFVPEGKKTKYFKLNAGSHNGVEYAFLLREYHKSRQVNDGYVYVPEKHELKLCKAYSKESLKKV